MGLVVSLSAQVTVDQNQNVGVGTDEPQQKVHVYSENHSVIKLAGKVNSGISGIEMTETSTAIFGDLGYKGIRLYYDAREDVGKNTFRLESSNNGEVMETFRTSRNTGYLGVGFTLDSTDIPQQPLHVNGGALITGSPERPEPFLAISNGYNKANGGEIRMVESPGGEWNYGFKFRLDGVTNRLVLERNPGANASVSEEVFNIRRSNGLMDIKGALSVGEDLEVGGSVKLQDVLKLVPLSTPPSNPEKGDVYIHDGTNPDGSDTKLRYYNGNAWIDL